MSEIYQASGHQVIGTSLSAMAAENLGVEAGITSRTLHSWLNTWNRYQETQEKFLSFDNVVALNSMSGIRICNVWGHCS